MPNLVHADRNSEDSLVGMGQIRHLIKLPPNWIHDFFENKSHIVTFLWSTVSRLSPVSHRRPNETGGCLHAKHYHDCGRHPSPIYF